MFQTGPAGGHTKAPTRRANLHGGKVPDDFFRFIADAAIQTVVGLYQGRKPKIRVGLEWDEPKEDHTAPYAGPGTAPRAGEEEAEDTVWPEAFDQ